MSTTLLESTFANSADLVRLRKLESQGHFQHGYADASEVRLFKYLARVCWLIIARELPGAPPYIGPKVT
jgi:hypothetical protein